MRTKIILPWWKFNWGFIIFKHKMTSFLPQAAQIHGVLRPSVTGGKLLFRRNEGRNRAGLAGDALFCPHMLRWFHVFQYLSFCVFSILNVLASTQVSLGFLRNEMTAYPLGSARGQGSTWSAYLIETPPVTSTVKLVPWPNHARKGRKKSPTWWGAGLGLQQSSDWHWRAKVSKSLFSQHTRWMHEDTVFLL